MDCSNTDIAVLQSPNSLNSAVLGLVDTFNMCNQIMSNEGYAHKFTCSTINQAQLASVNPNILIIPPSVNAQFYMAPPSTVCELLRNLHKRNILLCSVCDGAFLLANAGLLDRKSATTHWKLADQLKKCHPSIAVDAQKILVTDETIITAGGIMAWTDLCLEIVRLKTNAHIMRQLGRHLIVDSGRRQQSYYQSFLPNTQHGDKQIYQAQQYIQQFYSDSIIISELAQTCLLSERTFLRRFAKATGFKPKEYLQRLRIQKACELFENSENRVENVATMVGYRDISAFRKTFVKSMGLTPSEFSHRFSDKEPVPSTIEC